MEQLAKGLVSRQTKREGFLESASKRVRMIFSVMASPNRIDILRILNSKGPKTYSELKSLAGFRSKKESGKFAYHLRKLLRQTLVALNKSERRYTITNLGKLVLSLARQIEERSIVESGKMYVRTSVHSIDEFNSNKIIQSLVREANMPLEQAQKITEEVENKIYKLPATYLTSSLIREIVNSTLLEHGYEEYRNKLARLGLPLYDVFKLISDLDNNDNGVETLFNRSSKFIFSEYLLSSTLTKDIADMHFNGDIHLSDTGSWGLIPDTIFLDVKGLDSSKNFDLNGKFLSFTRINEAERDISTWTCMLNSLLSKEAAYESVIENLFDLLCAIPDGEISKVITQSLSLSSFSTSHSSSLVNLPICLDNIETSTCSQILNGYCNYAKLTPYPKFGISILYKNPEKLEPHFRVFNDIIKAGGIFSLNNSIQRSLKGIRKSSTSNNILTLHGLTVNLPKIALQSNKDETYFRAKLALLLKPSIIAMLERKNLITDIIRKEMLPGIYNITNSMNYGFINSIINLYGLKDSVFDIMGYNNSNNGYDTIKKVLKTSSEVVRDQAKSLGEEDVGISIVDDYSIQRFSQMNAERYGFSDRSSISSAYEFTAHGIVISGNKILQEFSKDLIHEINGIDELLKGGLSITADMRGIGSNDDMRKILRNMAELPFVKPVLFYGVCKICGEKLNTQQNMCNKCGSSKVRPF